MDITEEKPIRLVKQDIDFLEYPLWILDRNAQMGFSFEDRKGFFYRSGYYPPSKIDMIFLYFFLLESQKKNWANELNFSQYEVLKGCGIQPGKSWRKRLKESLRRWTAVVIEFEGTFYDGNTYQSMLFHIIEKSKVDTAGRITIKLSSDWLSTIQNSTFYKMLNFDELKLLRNPLATRLYEILVKSFQGRDVWEVEAKKLALKMPMKEKYASHITSRIKTALKDLNGKTELKIELKVRKPERGKAILRFRKLKKENEESPTTKLPLVALEGEDSLLFALLKSVRKDQQDNPQIQNLLEKWLKKLPPSELEQKILYANKKAKKNYRNFLASALQNDWKVEEKDKNKSERLPQQQKEQSSEEENKRKRVVFVRELFENFPEEIKESIRKPLRTKLRQENTPESMLGFALAAAVQEYMLKNFGHMK